MRYLAILIEKTHKVEIHSFNDMYSPSEAVLEIVENNPVKYAGIVWMEFDNLSDLIFK